MGEGERERERGKRGGREQRGEGERVEREGREREGRERGGRERVERESWERVARKRGDRESIRMMGKKHAGSEGLHVHAHVRTHPNKNTCRGMSMCTHI